jgi:hypothetical protein
MGRRDVRNDVVVDCKRALSVWAGNEGNWIPFGT